MIYFSINGPIAAQIKPKTRHANVRNSNHFDHLRQVAAFLFAAFVGGFSPLFIFLNSSAFTPFSSISNLKKFKSAIIKLKKVSSFLADSSTKKYAITPRKADKIQGSESQAIFTPVMALPAIASQYGFALSKANPAMPTFQTRRARLEARLNNGFTHIFVSFC